MKFLCLFVSLSVAVAFTTVPHKVCRHDSRALLLQYAKKPNTNKPPPSEEESKNNWIERVDPLDIDNDKEGLSAQKMANAEEYNVGIDGTSFQTGTLAGRMFEAMSKRQDEDLISDEIQRSFKMLAMDLAAKEATKLAMKQNGFDMEKENQDMDYWAEVESVQFLTEKGRPDGPVRDSWDDAVDFWTPGQQFSFVAKGVTAKLKELVLSDVLSKLDPDGSLEQEAVESGMSMPTEDAQSLKDLMLDVTRRREDSPEEVMSDNSVFKGTKKRGYSVIKHSDLMENAKNADGSENQKALMHVMDALVGHGCLLVDLSDGGQDFTLPMKMAKMWETTQLFFDSVDSNVDQAEMLPRMAAIEASPHAKMGYADFNNGMKFLETRIERETGSVLPNEAADIVGSENLENLQQAYEAIVNVGKNVVRIATAASSEENNGFSGPSPDSPGLSGLSFLTEDDLGDANDETVPTRASQSASLMVKELLDDGSEIEGYDNQGSVSMSPHRLCQYHNQKQEAPTEIFGAHTDTSFVTLVPVAAKSGLEVLDEAAKKWYRPELHARAVWEEERNKDGKDSSVDEEEVSDDVSIPWYARYLVVVPGEFLQICTRQEILAAVHRVVAGGPARLSAPVLLRGRPGVPFNVERYLGTINDPLLQDVDGKLMQDIHDALQPSFQ